MPQLTAPTQATINTWNIRERGVRDGASPNEAFEIDASSATRTFRVAWEQRGAAIAWFLGQSQTWLDTSVTPNVTRLSRLMPQTHPNYPGLAATKVTGIRGHQWTGNVVPITPEAPYVFSATQINQFTDCEFTVLYEHVPFQLSDDTTTYAEAGGEINRYVSLDDTDVSGEYLTLPAASFVYLGSTTPPNGSSIMGAPGRIMPQEVFRATWHRAPDSIWEPASNLYQRIYGTAEGDSVIPFLGTINTTALFGREIGTCLLTGVQPKRRRSPLGVGYEWDIQFEWTYKPAGHNWLYYINRADATKSGWFFVGPAGGTIHTADTVPDNYSIYSARDHTQLFSAN